MDPLFVEQMTKAVLEAENQDAARRTVGKVPSPTFAVPESLHASLMARLDRLGPAKEVAFRAVYAAPRGIDRGADNGVMFCRAQR